jgi:hypothetical protein
MITFAGHTFDDHQATFICTHIAEGMPALVFTHDSDGDLQFLCGADGHGPEECLHIGLSHMLEQMGEMLDMPTVDPGFQAQREYAGGSWTLFRSTC